MEHHSIDEEKATSDNQPPTQTRMRLQTMCCWGPKLGRPATRTRRAAGRRQALRATHRDPHIYAPINYQTSLGQLRVRTYRTQPQRERCTTPHKLPKSCRSCANAPKSSSATAVDVRTDAAPFTCVRTDDVRTYDGPFHPRTAGRLFAVRACRRPDGDAARRRR